LHRKAEVRGEEQKLDVRNLMLEENARQAGNVKRMKTEVDVRSLMLVESGREAAT
jgi:hypothetical protein